MHPDPAGRVRVVDQLVQLVLLGVGVAPDLGVPDEEQLGLRQVAAPAENGTNPFLSGCLLKYPS